MKKSILYLNNVSPKRRKIQLCLLVPAVDEIKGLCSDIVSSTVQIYDQITTQLLPTPAKSHYTFNLRDLSKVFQGMLMMEIGKIEVICSR